MTIKIKVCGLTRREDVQAACQAGADLLGFIFSTSPRRIEPEQAGLLIRTVPPEIERVGVFVNETENYVEQTARQAGLSMVQLHGDESPEYCRRIGEQTGLPVIKVLRAGGEQVLAEIPRFETGYLLLEPCVPGQYGGTGQQADWPLAARIVAAFPGRRFFLAGGLNPENACLAARTVQPYGLDASSGLEDAPGIKNPHKIIQFIEEVRAL